MALSGYGVGACMISIVSEGLKAAGRPRVLVSVHLVSFTCATAAMIALLGLDVIGVCLGLSAGLLVGGAYGLIRLGRILEVPLRSIASAIWPPAVAAMVMAAVLLPLDPLLLSPEDHGTALALLFIGVEGVLGFVVFMLLLRLLAPQTVTELIVAVQAAVRRGVGGDIGRMTITRCREAGRRSRRAGSDQHPNRPCGRKAFPIARFRRSSTVSVFGLFAAGSQTANTRLSLTTVSRSAELMSTV